MAAGLGFKTFTTGEVLTAADTNGYLMQGVLVFASSAARALAVTSPQEGQYSYLKDTNSTEYYDGAAWIAAPIGDITGVTAGTGISGGGTSGTVTITNSMATEITAKGDLIVGTGSATFDNLAVGTNNQILVADSTASTGLAYKGIGVANGLTTTGDTIYSSSGTTQSRLGIGSTGQVLTVAGGVPSWATPAGGGKVLQVIQGTYTASTDISIATSTLTDTNLTATITPAATSSKILVMVMQFALGYRTYQYAGSKFALVRGSTNIGSTIVSGTNSYELFSEGSSGIGYAIKGWYAYTLLDSPSTTSATTYKIQMAPLTTANSGVVQVLAGFQSNIILMEIGA